MKKAKRILLMAIAAGTLAAAIAAGSAAPGRGNADVLVSALSSSGATAGKYAAWLYQAVAGRQDDTALEEWIQKFSSYLRLNGGITIEKTGNASNISTAFTLDGMNICIDAAYDSVKEKTFLVLHIKSKADKKSMASAENIIMKAQGYLGGAQVFREVFAETGKLDKKGMAELCRRIINKSKGCEAGVHEGPNYISALAYVPGESIYQMADGKRFNLQIAIRQMTNGRSRLVIGFPAILSGY